MLEVQWIKEAKANGWIRQRSTGAGVRLKCSKQGCNTFLDIAFNNMKAAPDPCDKPHTSQYAAKTFDQYVSLVGELSRRRRSLGLSQEDICNAAGLADGHINKLEAFHRTAQFPTLQLWASTLGMNITLSPCPLPDAIAKKLSAMS